LAARTVAGYRILKVHIDFKPYRAALAATTVMLNSHQRTPLKNLEARISIS
jgi:hypothetical protein